MKRPSVFAENGQSTITPLTMIHTTTTNGSRPSTRESTRIMGRKLPPLLLFLFFGTWFALFAPELVAGAVDEYILQRGFADGDCLNLAGERLDQVGNEAVAALALDANLVAHYGRFYVETGEDGIGQNIRVTRRIQHDYVAANFALQF